MTEQARSQGSRVNHQLATEVKQVPVGYKQTEVGVIPEDWGIVCMREIVKDHRLPSGIYKDKRLYSTGTKIIKLGDVFNFDEFRPECAQRVQLSENEIRAYSVEVDDIFLALASVKLEGVGKVMLVKELDEPTAYDHNVALIRVTAAMQSDYLAYLFKSAYVRKLVAQNATQVGTSFLKASTILGFALPLPSTKEQTAIANALSDVDALISELEKLIAKKKAIKTATMQQLLTGRTRLPQFALRDDGTPTNSSGTNLDSGTGGPKGEGHDGLRKGTKPSELGEIPADWEVVTLGDLVEICSGDSPSKFQFLTDGVPYFKVEQLNNGSVYADETPYYIQTSRVVRAGSIIFPKRGASILSNKIRVLKRDSFMDTNLMTLTCSSEMDEFYLHNQLLYRGLDSVADTTSIPQINNKHIYPYLIPFTVKEEQTAIATILSDMDAEIQALEQRLGKTRQIKQGMMQELLTGKTRLIKPSKEVIHE
ncbi:hypothetical protein FJM67_15285 [Maribrevibacterium harenarium]|uniref:Type I restriction modification DNA specificity domain-containing protein n=1 Tax=Maribrevibacterium harenarium TaxID=2589817 RepID=A0A501WIR6_9GAMM|nr:restriction endonuclease subunit S [Maribrevibacterium harenarium]TPE46971.1 hypothetical protein FJM67_15285 [Maribrevibacterium harenarium]